MHNFNPIFSHNEITDNGFFGMNWTVKQVWRHKSEAQHNRHAKGAGAAGHVANSSMESLIFTGLLLCLLTAATSMSGHVSVAAAASATASPKVQAEVSGAGSSWGNQLPDMLVSYFLQHGVHSLMLVVCHGDIGELRAL